jgi:hypothetical protein
MMEGGGTPGRFDGPRTLNTQRRGGPAFDGPSASSGKHRSMWEPRSTAITMSAPIARQSETGIAFTTLPSTTKRPSSHTGWSDSRMPCAPTVRRRSANSRAAVTASVPMQWLGVGIGLPAGGDHQVRNPRAGRRQSGAVAGRLREPSVARRSRRSLPRPPGSAKSLRASASRRDHQHLAHTWNGGAIRHVDGAVAADRDRGRPIQPAQQRGARAVRSDARQLAGVGRE